MSSSYYQGISWEYRTLNEFTPLEVMEMLRLRSKAFVVDDKCIYEDIDGQDYLMDRPNEQGFQTFHLTGTLHSPMLPVYGSDTKLVGKKLVACCRIIPPHRYGEPFKIGRVVVDPIVRGQNVGTRMIELAIGTLFDRCGREVAINLSAQAHLADRFYGSIGFQYYGAPYDEDGIQHIAMRLATRRQHWPVIARPLPKAGNIYGCHPSDLKAG